MWNNSWNYYNTDVPHFSGPTFDFLEAVASSLLPLVVLSSLKTSSPRLDSDIDFIMEAVGLDNTSLLKSITSFCLELWCRLIRVKMAFKKWHYFRLIVHMVINI